MAKNLPANAGDAGLIPELGRSPRVGNGNPLQYSLPGESHGQRSLEGHSSRGRRDWDTTEHARTIIIFRMFTFLGVTSLYYYTFNPWVSSNSIFSPRSKQGLASPVVMVTQDDAAKLSQGGFSNPAFHKPAEGHLFQFYTWRPHSPYPSPVLTKRNRSEPGTLDFPGPKGLSVLCLEAKLGERKGCSQKTDDHHLYRGRLVTPRTQAGWPFQKDL